jgi:uncharacterized protein
VPTLPKLQGHPKVGSSWEGFALEQTLDVLHSRNAYFWATHAGAELDLLLRVSGKHYGVEFKYADAPGRHRSMHTAIQDLRLQHLWVIYPGHQEYSLDMRISVVPLGDALKYLKDL